MKTLARLAIAGAAGMIAWKLHRQDFWKEFNGKVVLITGGSRGLGLQLAREFGARGAHIAICARSTDELERAKQDLAERGVKAHTLACDVSDQSQVERMISETVQQLGPIDVLVNNVGLIRVGPVWQQTTNDFEQVMHDVLG
jgi:NAD(P)-dependent dehydrogenase (short-subunit alcohol dehydrogenase family)